MGNVIKFIDFGLVRVLVELIDVGKKMVIIIFDSGIGIFEYKYKVIFEFFE